MAQQYRQNTLPLQPSTTPLAAGWDSTADIRPPCLLWQRRLFGWQSCPCAWPVPTPLLLVVQVFSNSLRDAKRNADSILHSAQNSEPVLRIRSGLDQWETSVRADVLRAQKSATQQLERLKLAEPRFSAGFPRPRTGSAADDGVLIKRLTQGGEGKKLPGVRRVKSSADLTRPRRSSGKSTALADTGSPRGVLHANSEVVAAAAQWDLVSVLQNSITSANGRTPGGQPMYPMLPAPGLADSKLVDGQVSACHFVSGNAASFLQNAVCWTLPCNHRGQQPLWAAIPCCTMLRARSALLCRRPARARSSQAV